MLIFCTRVGMVNLMKKICMHSKVVQVELNKIVKIDINTEFSKLLNLIFYTVCYYNRVTVTSSNKDKSIL